MQVNEVTNEQIESQTKRGTGTASRFVQLIRLFELVEQKKISPKRAACYVEDQFNALEAVTIEAIETIEKFREKK